MLVCENLLSSEYFENFFEKPYEPEIVLTKSIYFDNIFDIIQNKQEYMCTYILPLFYDGKYLHHK
jgi:hypothetical protein